MSEAATAVPVTEDTSIVPKAPEHEKHEQKGDSTYHRAWWPFESLRREVERAYEDFQRGPWRLPFMRTPFDAASVWPGEFMWRAMPAADIHEHDDSYSISVELPGLTAADVQVTLSNDHLVISGEKKEEIKEEKKNIHLSERRYGSFERTFRLPSGVDRDKIAASCKNGILTVLLPKTAEEQQNKRMIEVQAR